MSKTHVVAQGECLSLIAYRHGFRDYRTVYDHPANAAFRKKRPDPNLVYPGDELFIPDREKKTVSLVTDRAHRVEVKPAERRLRLRFLAHDLSAMASAPGRLFLDGAVWRDGLQTDDTGSLDVPIPVEAQSGRIEVGPHGWDLAIGDLDPVPDTPDDGLSGHFGRLYNLGYDLGPSEDGLTPEGRAMLRWFQRARGLDDTGELDDATKAAILSDHQS